MFKRVTRLPSSGRGFFVLALIGWLVLTLGTVAGCDDDDDDNSGPQTVSWEINEDVDFSLYETFNIVDSDEDTEPADGGVSDGGVEPPDDYERMEEEFITEITRQMEELGLAEVEEDPDLSVSVFVKTEETDSDVTFYSYYYGYYWGYEYTWTVNVEYMYGTVIIDVVDLGDDNDISNDDVLAFRGIVEGISGQILDVALLQIRNAVNAVFAGWPVTEEEPE